jgi:hypothetical protein
MSRFDNFLDQNNLYSRPSSLINNVNSYLGENQASLPYDNTSPAQKSNPISSPVAYGLNSGQYLGQHQSGPDIQGKAPDLLGDFMNKLGSLQPGHRNLLLQMVGGESGTISDDKSGVSPQEWASLFGLDQEYSNRFQGFPDLLNLQDDIRNVYAGGEQKKKFETKSAQEAMIQSMNKPTSGGLRMGGLSNKVLRRQMTDTLNQRLLSTEEATAGRYANLLSLLDSRINAGFSIAGDILNMNPEAQDDVRIDPDTGGTSTVNWGDRKRTVTRATKRT